MLLGDLNVCLVEIRNTLILNTLILIVLYGAILQHLSNGKSFLLIEMNRLTKSTIFIVVQAPFVNAFKIIEKYFVRIVDKLSSVF